MDLSFSARSRTLPLVSSFHSSAKTHRIRRRFLSSSRNSAPPFPLRSRCRELRGNKSRRLAIAASIESDTVVVVVSVTVISVFSIAYFNRYLNCSGKKEKKRHAASEVSDSWGLHLSELGTIIVDQVIGKWFGDVASAEAQGKGLVWKSKGNGMELLIQETTSAHNDTVAVGSVQSSASADCRSVALKESEDVCLSFAGLGVLEPGPVLPVMFATELSELRLVQETKPDSLVDESVLKVRSGTAIVSMGHESDERLGFSGYFGSLRETVREDLYSFCGGSPLVATSPLNMKDIGAVTSPFSPLNCKSFSSLKVKTKLKGEEQLAHDSLKTAEHVERKVTLARHDGGSFHQTKRSALSKGSPNHKDKKHLIKDKQTRLPRHPHLNGAHSDANDHVPSLFSAYNHLLRNGRLSECIDVLEYMEQRGLLDMNKVYHAKFFKICKSQNAVKEAFRFFKLVPNPTLSTFNMLMSVCASSQDHEGAFRVLQLAQENGLKADCKLYTTLISTCAKCGKVDAMFEVFHEMVNAGVEPNVHTYGALIDGCARVGQVAKAFGAYGIMRSKNVKPDCVVFNALITACGKSGAVDRAFDVLAEMNAEKQPIEPDHITVGALMKACAMAGQVHRAQEVYKMIHEYKIKGTPEVYTIAVNCGSLTGDWEFASRVYDDMIQNEVAPDEMFLSALIDVAGHAGKVDTAFEILQKARAQGINLGIMTFSSLMGACSNSKNWQKALELYEEMKSIKLGPTVSTINALITALCDGDQLSKAIAILSEMRSFGLCPNTITYSILLVASGRLNDMEVGLMLLSQAKHDSISPNLVMCKCIIGMCLRRFEKAFSLGEPIVSFDTGRLQIENEWTSIALMVYRETIAAGQIPTMEVVSQVLGCLQLPCDAPLKSRLVENLGVSSHPSSSSNLCSLVDGFGEYDSRAFSLLEEAASLGIVPCVSFEESLMVVDAKELQIHIAVVYMLTILRGLKHRLAAGAKLPNVTILLPVEQAKVTTPKGETTINLAGRVGQAVASLLRRLGIRYQGSESYGKIRINGISLRRWLRPKLASPLSGKPQEFSLSLTHIGKGIFNQQRSIRTGDLTLE